MTAVDTERAEWLEWRRGGIGASDVPGLLGISPWSSPWSIWADKLGLLPPEPENEQMRAGRWLEAAIGPWFTSETGLYVAGQQTKATHPEHDHHRATPDGFVLTEEPAVNWENLWPLGFAPAPDAGFEIKVTGPGRRWDRLPEYHQAQGQWQMHVTGLDRVWFAVLMGRRLDVHPLDRDQADIDFMAAEVDRFWAEHVLTRKPPPPDSSEATERALLAVYGDPVRGEVVEADADTRQAVADLADAKARRKAAKEDEQEAGNRIRSRLGNATELTVNGQLVASWRTQTSTHLDQRRLKAEQPEIARQYATQSTIRVLRPHAPKREKR